MIALVERDLVRLEQISAKAEAGKSGQDSAVPSPVAFQPVEDRDLIFLVGNAESGLQADVRAELPQQLRAERVDGSALDQLYAGAELLEAGRDFVRCLVGEGEYADSLRINPKVLDEVPNALDEAEGLACTWPGKDEDRARRGLDRVALRGSRNARRIRCDRRTDGRDRVRSGNAGDGSCQEAVLVGIFWFRLSYILSENPDDGSP